MYKVRTLKLLIIKLRKQAHFQNKKMRKISLLKLAQCVTGRMADSRGHFYEKT